MSDEARIMIGGYEVALDRGYEPDTDLWVLAHGSDRVRVGLSSLGVDTLGSLAQLAVSAVGTRVEVGEPLGSMEAEKFVGPLLAPVRGEIVAVNEAVLAEPRLVHVSPNDAWVVELVVTGDPMAGLVTGDAIDAWYRDKIADYRRQGVLAE